MGGSSSSTPAAPDLGKLEQQGIDVLFKNLPQLLNTEEAYRQTVDPQRIADQQALQDQFGKTQYQQQLDALHQLDPESAKVRADLAKHVQDDLASGYDLGPEYSRQIEQSVRGAQAARGNIYGSGPASVEAAVKGKAALDMYQQRLQNAGNFLSSPTPEQQLLAVQSVSPDRGMAYVNPSAGALGASFGLQNYQNMLAQQQLQQSSNPWTKALGGAAAGASAGSAAGPYGALIGGVAGGALGYFGSDERLKTDVHEIAKTKGGIPLIRFKFLGSNRMYIGTSAQAVKKVRPDAVREGEHGYLMVNYGKLGLPYFELKEEGNVWQHA
jgi:hypothetical protein